MVFLSISGFKNKHRSKKHPSSFSESGCSITGYFNLFFPDHKGKVYL